jgi:hypothetical protein
MRRLGNSLCEPAPSGPFEKGSQLPAILMAGLFSVVATLVTYAGYLYSDQIEHLPIVLRALDPEYLQRDFFVNASTQSPARYYYARFLSWAAGSEHNLPLVIFLLTFASNLMTAIASYLAATSVFNKRRLAGVVAAALAMCVVTVGYGYAGSLWVEFLRPFSLAQGLSFLAFAFMMRDRLPISAVFIAPAVLVHPLFGLQAAAVTGGVYLLAAIGRNRTLFPSGALRQLAVYCCVLIIPVMVVLRHEVVQIRIEDSLFIDILAHVRHQHIYLPSSFAFHEHVYGVAVLISLVALQHTSGLPKGSWQVTAVLLTIWLLICLALVSWFFTEVVPVRAFVVFQPLRLLMYVKWLLIVLAAGAITAPRPVGGGMRSVVYAAACLNPLSLAFAASFDWLHNFLRGREGSIVGLLLSPAVSLAGVGLILAKLYTPPVSLLLFSGFAVMNLAFVTLTRRPWLAAAVILVTGLSVVAVRYDQIKANVLTNAPRHDLGRYGNDVADFARTNLPADAVVFTPPMWGAFRVLGKRAMVVDFKSFPFGDQAMLDWLQRFEDCYGNARSGAEVHLRNYRAIEDRKLSELSDKYGVTHAVLAVDTPTSSKTLFGNSKYKVITLRESGLLN